MHVGARRRRRSRAAPVTKLARSEARNAITSATSSGRPNRPIGIGCFSSMADMMAPGVRPVRSADATAFRVVADVSMMPGSTQFTRTPIGAKSSGAHLRVADECRLRRRIRGDEAVGLPARCRRDVDDRRRPAIHDRKQCGRETYGTQEVQLEGTDPILVRKLTNSAGARAADVVHEDVDTTQFVDCSRRQESSALFRGQVGDDSDGSATLVADRRHESVELDFGSRADRALRRRVPRTTRRSRARYHDPRP